MKPNLIYISLTGLYFRNHISYDLHLWYICFYKRIISPGIFFIFFKALIFKIIRGEVKGQKMVQSDKNFVCLTPDLRNCTSYDCDFWCTCVKWWYLQQIFSFFKILLFGAFRGIKGKNDYNINKFWHWNSNLRCIDFPSSAYFSPPGN